MTTTTTGVGLRRPQHLGLWVSNVERGVRFYRQPAGEDAKDVRVAW